MKTILEGKKTIETLYLSDDCPYFKQISSDKTVVSLEFKEIINSINVSDRQFNITQLIPYLQYNYLCGNGTFIMGLERMPLHSRLESNGTLSYRENIKHSHEKYDLDILSKKIYVLLKKEMIEYVGDSKEVYLTLSGGLDSRISAGILKKVQGEKDLKVNVLFWGSEKSIDYKYASMICKLYNWKMHNFKIDPELLKTNVELSVDYIGAEVCAIHFHGEYSIFERIPQGAKIIASSYGDSIGRAEFSRKHLRDLKKEQKPKNYCGLIYKDIYKIYRKEAMEQYHLFSRIQGEKDEVVKNEIFMQENYMRRMIDEVFRFLSVKFKFYQMFTSKEIVELMWSVDPVCRDSKLYLKLIPYIDPELESIPWARTGKSIDGKVIEKDKNIQKDFHDYLNWTKNEFKDMIEKNLFKENSEIYEIINKKYLLFLWKDLLKDRHDDYEIFWKVIGIIRLIKKYDIKVEPSKKKSSNPFLFIFYRFKLRARKIKRNFVNKC